MRIISNNAPATVFFHRKADYYAQERIDMNKAECEEVKAALDEVLARLLPKVINVIPSWTVIPMTTPGFFRLALENLEYAISPQYKTFSPRELTQMINSFEERQREHMRKGDEPLLAAICKRWRGEVLPSLPEPEPELDPPKCCMPRSISQSRPLAPIFVRRDQL
jgi:hypothetical protein